MSALVTQKNYSDCMLAAIAMAAGKSYDELWTPEDSQLCVDKHGCTDEMTSTFLERIGFKVNTDVWRCYIYAANWNEYTKRLFKGRRAIFSIPSLNHEGGFHAVFWDGKKILDPNNGFPGKQFYQWIDHIAPPQSAWIFEELP